MKLEYNLINGKTEKEFLKNVTFHVKDILPGFNIIEAITQEAVNAITNIDSELMSSIIAGYSNPKMMNGVDMKGFPYLLFTDPETYELTFYIGREASNYHFDFFLDSTNPLTPVFSDTLKLLIIEKDGTITTKTINAVLDNSTSDTSIINTMEEDNKFHITYNKGTH